MPTSVLVCLQQESPVAIACKYRDFVVLLCWGEQLLALLHCRNWGKPRIPHRFCSRRQVLLRQLALLPCSGSSSSFPKYPVRWTRLLQSRKFFVWCHFLYLCRFKLRMLRRFPDWQPIDFSHSDQWLAFVSYSCMCYNVYVIGVVFEWGGYRLRFPSIVVGWVVAVHGTTRPILTAYSFVVTHSLPWFPASSSWPNRNHLKTHCRCCLQGRFSGQGRHPQISSRWRWIDGSWVDEFASRHCGRHAFRWRV